MEILYWIIEKTEKYGLKTVLLIFVGIAIIIGIFVQLWGLEKDVEIKPYIDTSDVLQQDIEKEVTRTGKVSDGISIASITTDVLSGISSETEAMNTFSELVDAADQIQTKKETLIIPKGAGYCEMGGMTIYEWKKSGKHFLTGTEFSESHAALLYNGQYVSVSIGAHEAISFGADIEVGTY